MSSIALKRGCSQKDICKYLEENVENKVIVFVSHYDDNEEPNKPKEMLQNMGIDLKKIMKGWSRVS